MTHTQIAAIEFHGYNLLTIHDGARAWTSPKAICEILEVNWNGQLAKLKSDLIFSQGMQMICIPSSGGMQETAMLDIDLVQGWLLSIDPRKVKPEARDQLILFKLECYKALANYWRNGAAFNPRFARSEGQPDLVRTTHLVMRLMADLKKLSHPEERATAHAALAHACASINIPCPSLDSLGRTAPMIDAVTAPFFDLIAALEGLNAPVNHARRSDRLAIRPAEVRALADHHGLHADLGPRLWKALRAHPSFVDVMTINSRNGAKSRHCWVFERRQSPRLALPHPLREHS